MRLAALTGRGRAWMAPTSGRRRGRRHPSSAGRPAEDGQQAAPDLRRTRYPLKVITTAATVNDVTQTLALVDGIPPVAGRPRRRPEALLGDKGYGSNPNRDKCVHRLGLGCACCRSAHRGDGSRRGGAPAAQCEHEPPLVKGGPPPRARVVVGRADEAGLGRRSHARDGRRLTELLGGRVLPWTTHFSTCRRRLRSTR
ncbi:transposase [Streptomyces sp. NPDC085639]|uniref:transposase n=1 Tax=Streptomyces sp. NPDC085639 TaxID=3365734 RepID=UPI0037D0BB0F